MIFYELWLFVSLGKFLEILEQIMKAPVRVVDMFKALADFESHFPFL